MSKKIVIVLVGALIGFAFGYIVFAQIMGVQVGIAEIFSFSGGGIGKLSRSIVGVEAVQQKVFISTGVGAVLGLAYALLKKK